MVFVLICRVVCRGAAILFPTALGVNNRDFSGSEDDPGQDCDYGHAGEALQEGRNGLGLVGGRDGHLAELSHHPEADEQGVDGLAQEREQREDCPFAERLPGEVGYRSDGRESDYSAASARCWPW